MADLSQAYSEVKSLPDEVLSRELKQPSGMIPGYLILGEMQERKALRNSTAEGKPLKPKSIAEEFVGTVEPYAAAIRPKVPQEGGQGIAGLPQGAEQPVQGYAEGGIVDLVRRRRKALLDTIAGPESAGKYNVMYGGKHFEDYSQHPGVSHPIQSGPNAGKTSSAAGKYQFLKGTWQEQAQKLGLKDFSPASQDAAAWNLAAEKFGGSDRLDAILASGDPNQIASVGRSLNGIWTSLPGGIEQGTNQNAFVSAFNNNYASPETAAAMGMTPVVPVEGTVPVVPVTTTPVAVDAAPVSSAASGLQTMMAMQMIPQLMGMNQQQSAPAEVQQQVAPRGTSLDPYELVARTSMTPDVYEKRRRRRA